MQILRGIVLKALLEYVRACVWGKDVPKASRTFFANVRLATPPSENKF